MLEINNVSKSFGKKKVIDNISLTVENSSICGLVGYNGAGKTTLLKMISAVYGVDEGEILLNGKNTATCPAIRRELYYVADDLWFPSLSNLNSMAKFCEDLYDNFSRETFNRLVEMMGLNPKAKIASFSKGMRRQAAIILALASRPSLILIDESFDGLDPQKRDLVKKLLMEYISEKEGSILISSHNIRELSDLCDHIVLMNNSQIKLSLEVEDLVADKYKIRLVFDVEPDDEKLTDCGIKGIKHDGRIISGFISDDGNINEKINGLSPIVFDKFPMTLEEVLLNEMGGADYDFKELF